MKTLSKRSLTAVSAVLIASAPGATVFIDLTTELTATQVANGDPAISTGDLLDVGTGLNDLPFTVDVVEEAITALGLTVVSGSSFDPANTTVNGAGGSFGVNSPTPSGGIESASRFDVDAAEQLTISFTQDVYLLNVDFTNLGAGESFTVATVTGISDSNTPNTDIHDFTDGGTTPGLFFAAGTGIFFEVTGDAGSSVGLQGLTIETIPEPTSSLFLSASCFALLLRRRR